MCLRIFVLARRRAQAGRNSLRQHSTTSPQMIVSCLLFSATYICSWELPAPSKETEVQLLGSFLPKSHFDVKLGFNLPRSHFFLLVPNFCHIGTEKNSDLEGKKFFWLVEVSFGFLVSIQRTLSHSGDSGGNVILSAPQLLSWVPTSWLGPKEVEDMLYPTNQWKTQWQKQDFLFQFISRSLLS